MKTTEWKKEMNESKYKILRDYSSENFVFDDEEFETVDSAVKHALASGYSSPFLIVRIINWEAKEL